MQMKINEKGSVKILIIILVILIIALGVLLGYKIIKDKENKEETASIRGR